MHLATTSLVGLLVVAGAVAPPALAQVATATTPDPDGITKVEVFVFLVDVSRIDSADQSFEADVFVQARWMDLRLAQETLEVRRLALTDVWHPRLQIVNQRNLWTSFPDEVEVSPDGSVVQRQRYHGRFTASLDMRAFPFDEHVFSVQLIAQGYTVDQVTLVPDSTTPESARSATLTVPDWVVGEVVGRTAPFEPLPGWRVVSGFEARFPAGRRVGAWIGKGFASLTIIVLMAWVVFWLDIAQTPARVSFSVTAMLTLIANRFILGQALPQMPYMTRLDVFLLGATTLVFINLALVAVISRLQAEGRTERAAAVNRGANWAYPLLVAALFAVTLTRG